MRHDNLIKVDLITLEANLSHPVDKISSQKAHASAAAMVAGFVQHYGLDTVRGWLRNGVPNGIELSAETSH